MRDRLAHGTGSVRALGLELVAPVVAVPVVMLSMVLLRRRERPCV